jgi:hypothetical protein
MEGISKEELMELFITDSTERKKPKKKRDLSEEQRKTMLDRLALMREKAAEKRGAKKAEVKEEVKAKIEPESVLEPRAEPKVEIKAEAVGSHQSYDKTVHEKILSQLTELNQHTKSLAELKREKLKPKQAEAPVLRRPLSPPPQTAQVKPTHYAAPPPKPEPVYVAPPPPQHVEPQYIMPNRSMIKKRGMY